MSNIPTASTSAASTSSASTSLASTSTSQLHPYNFRIEDECTTTDDSEISDDDFQILNSNVIGDHSFLPSDGGGSSDDASWSSIESSTGSSLYGDENSCSDDSNNMYILNGVVIRESDQMTVRNNEPLENSSDLASNATWAERTPTHEDSNEAKCPNHDEQNIPMLLYLEPSENEKQIDEIANGLINVAEHEKRLKELEKESEYIEITAWMYRPIDPAIR